jgi:hypothetical protein
MDLWENDGTAAWQEALERYPAVVERQGVAILPELDRWYREELPVAIDSRDPRAIVHEELVRVTRWKMARGVWRQRNLVLVRGNDADAVEEVSAEAIAAVPHPTRPISILSRLDGVGPATASAVAAAAAPGTYPFFDELVAGQIPSLGPTTFTMSFYARYAEELRNRAARLGSGWSAARVERALWSHAGGKNRE